MVQNIHSNIQSTLSTIYQITTIKYIFIKKCILWEGCGNYLPHNRQSYNSQIQKSTSSNKHQFLGKSKQ